MADAAPATGDQAESKLAGALTVAATPNTPGTAARRRSINGVFRAARLSVPMATHKKLFRLARHLNSPGLRNPHQNPERHRRKSKVNSNSKKASA